MRYSITLNFKKLINGLGKIYSLMGKWNFKLIINSAHTTTELFTLIKAFSENMDYLIYYPSRKHANGKKFQVQVYIQQC